MTKDGRVEITKIILKTLLVGVVVVGAAVIAPGIGPVLKMFMPGKNYDRKKFSRAFKNLEEQKMVSVSYKGKEAIISITEKGRGRTLKYNFEEIKLNKPKKWDGKWRIIIFDIPNRKKHQRDMFRMKLKNLGFTMIQKSTFVCPYPAKNEVDFIGEYLMIRKYITYILADKIEGSKNLYTKYELKNK